MRARFLPLTFLAASFSWSLALAQTQTAVSPSAEPRHHLVLANDQVRVFAFTLPPTEQAYVKYDHNVLVVTLEDCELVQWTEGQSDIMSYPLKEGTANFFPSGLPRGFRNNRTSACHNVVVEFLDPKIAVSYAYQPQTGWNYGPAVIAAAIDSHAKSLSELALGPGTVAEAQLLPGDSFAAPEKKKTAELLIALTDVDLKAQGDQHIRDQAGKVVWIPADRSSEMTNEGSRPARFIVVELPTEASEQAGPAH